MTLDAFFGWAFLAGALLGIALSIEVFVIRDLVAVARHILQYLRNHPHAR